jgi:WD40 repeat protein
MLASCSHDTDVIVWNLVTGTMMHHLVGHTYPVYDLIVISSHLIASCSEDKTIKVWNIINGTLAQTLNGHKGSVASLDMTSNGLLVSASSDGTIKYWQVSSTKQQITIERSIDTGSQIEALLVF